MTEPRNIENAIQTAQSAQTAPKKQTPASVMKALVNTTAVQDMLKQSLKENAGTFTASVIDLYGADKYLQNCAPSEVLQEALKAVSIRLPINKQLGFVWIVPRRTKGVWHPVFQIGYRGLIQLAMRSGAYRYINAGEVYEGEFKSYDKIRGIADISGEKKSDNVVGFFAYIETLNGFAKCEYWTKDRLIAHAARYSDSYKNGAAIWKDNFVEMGIKTVLANTLHKYGLLSVEMMTAISNDLAADNAEKAAGLLGDGAIPAEQIPGNPEAYAVPVDEQTGEVTEEVSE